MGMLMRFACLGWMCGLALINLSACSSFKPESRSSSSSLPNADLPNGAVIAQADGPGAAVQEALLAQLAQWRGTPYKMGGTGRMGIDCSAFVQTTLADHFRLAMPRSTEQQVQSGFEVEPEQMVPGDLVFFKNHKGGNHVGLYMGSRWFLHASTSAGVTLNSLDERYWRRHFWQARRVMFQ